MNTFAPALTLAAILSLPGALPSVAAPGDHNGTWAVELVTESGLCDARYSYAITVRDGQVRLASGGGGAQIGGRVSPDGAVGLTVSKGAATGSGVGRLAAGRGSGTWKVSSLCSGRWTARRGGTRTAQAE